MVNVGIYPGDLLVVDLTDSVRQQKLLQLVPVEEVWGIGRRLAQQLNQMGIHTAWHCTSNPSGREVTPTAAILPFSAGLCTHQPLCSSGTLLQQYRSGSTDPGK